MRNTSVCVQYYLQGCTQRIQRWREAGIPEVGIFYVMAGELWLESTPLSEARRRREVIIQSGNHRSYWHNLQRMIQPLQGLPHTCYPRGRVVYVKAPARYQPELGPELMTDADMGRQVMGAMHLPPEQTEVRLARHSRIRRVLS
jgi:hypothetical protein